VCTSLSIAICRSGLSLNCSMNVINKESRQDGSGGREYTGGFVINGLPTMRLSPTTQSLPSECDKPVAVIQAFPWRVSAIRTCAAALSSSRLVIESIFSPREFKRSLPKLLLGALCNLQAVGYVLRCLVYWLEYCVIGLLRVSVYLDSAP